MDAAYLITFYEDVNCTLSFPSFVRLNETIGTKTDLEAF